MTLMSTSRSGGFVLLMVLVVIMLASMVAASLLFVLSAEHTAAAAGDSGEQARATAMSGVYQAMRAASDATPGSIDWQDNATLFRDQMVTEEGGRKWFFSVYSVTGTETSPITYGITDEAAKINVFHATQPMLEGLPNMNAAIAQTVLAAAGASQSAPAVTSGSESSGITVTATDDLVDTNLPVPMISADSVASPGIAAPVNGWSVIDELLQVGGINSRMLYGSYSNYTGRIDTRIEAAGSDQSQSGLCQLLTVSSYDWNLDNQGQPRINLSDANADLTKAPLGKAAVDYLQAMRRNNLRLTNVADLLEATGKFKDEQGKEVTLNSEISKDELAGLLDRCTTTNATKLVGLVNLNTASAKVLAALPGMTDALAESIVSARVGLSSEARQTPAWLYQEGIVNVDTFKQVAPWLTTRSYQFHFFVAAYTIPATTFRVYEVIIDAGVKPAAVMALRDISRLGLPFVPTADPTQASARPSGANAVYASRSWRQPSIQYSGDYL